MALITTANTERELNITLTAPNGPETVNHLIGWDIAWSETHIGHKLECAEVADSFDGSDDPCSLSNPVNPELVAEDL